MANPRPNPNPPAHPLSPAQIIANKGVPAPIVKKG